MDILHGIFIGWRTFTVPFISITVKIRTPAFYSFSILRSLFIYRYSIEYQILIWYQQVQYVTWFTLSCMPAGNAQYILRYSYYLLTAVECHLSHSGKASRTVWLEKIGMKNCVCRPHFSYVSYKYQVDYSYQDTFPNMADWWRVSHEVHRRSSCMNSRPKWVSVNPHEISWSGLVSQTDWRKFARVIGSSAKYCLMGLRI